jgi:hypothetical protein
MQLPEKYKENFDVSSEGRNFPTKATNFETSKFPLYSIRTFLIIGTTYTGKAKTVVD